MNKKDFVKIKEGYLVKKGHVRHNWKTRWFVLYEDSLCYYKNKNDAEPIKAILLHGAAVIEETADYIRNKRKNVLKVITHESVEYYLQACTCEDRTQWTIAIGDVIRANDSARLKAVLPLHVCFKSSSGHDIQLNIRDFVSAMQDPDAGIPVLDHIVQKCKYPNCFTGSNLIEWLKTWSFVSNDDDGISLGSVLLNTAVIQFVVDSTDKSGLTELFINSPNVLYRFSSLQARCGKQLRSFPSDSSASLSSEDLWRSSGKVVKEGFLSKRVPVSYSMYPSLHVRTFYGPATGHIRQNWKVRKVVLKEHPSVLEYYALSKISSKPLRCLSLEDCLVIPVERKNIIHHSGDQHEVHENLFCLLMSSGVQYLFQAQSGAEKYEWVEAIRHLVFSSC